MAKKDDIDKFWDDILSETVKQCGYTDWRTVFQPTNQSTVSAQSNNVSSSISYENVQKAMREMERYLHEYKEPEFKETTIYDIAQQLKDNEKITITNSEQYQEITISISNPLEHRAIRFTKEYWLDEYNKQYLSRQLNNLLQSLRRINENK